MSKAEDLICERFVRDVERLGYGGAESLLEVQLGDGSGYVDLVLVRAELPRLVIVEAKRKANQNTAWNVIGQVLKYYGHGLLGTREGLEQLRTAPAKGMGRGAKKVSLASLYGTSDREASQIFRTGTKLTPADIDVVVALDEYPEDYMQSFDKRLGIIVETLRDVHSLPIGVAIAPADGPVRWKVPPRDGMA